MATFTIRKDPNAVLDYTYDWKADTNGSTDPLATDWLVSEETISSHTITADAGIAVDSSSLTDTNTSVTVWLSGGTAGTDYDVVCHIVTSAGREDDRTVAFSVTER